MKELTLKEVIANIKEGEVWECEGYKIRNLSNGDIQFVTPNGAIIGFRPKDRFNLSRKEYTFEEAFKAYEEGKEIECMKTGRVFAKHNGRDKVKVFFSNNIDWLLSSYCSGLSIEEIRSKWYIKNN